MRLKQIRRLTLKASLLLSLGLISACATPIPNACAWLTDITPDAGYKARWTENEKRTIEALDENIDNNCHR